MRFYYLSIFSLILLGVIYFVGTGLLVWFGAWLRKRMTKAWIVMVPLFVLLYVGPVAEEFWIAWNFGQLCKKDAGIFVYKTVEVEGFYDATMRSAYENTKPGGYRYVEHATEDRKGIERVQRADDALRARALAWYARTNPGKERPKERSIFYPLNARETVVVFPNGVDAWHVTTLDQPTARYHYRLLASHLPAGHGVKKFENVVVDTQTADVLGRYRNYYRSAPWFFIGLDGPTIPCRETEQDTRRYGTLMVYAVVFRPASGVDKVREQQ